MEVLKLKTDKAIRLLEKLGFSVTQKPDTKNATLEGSNIVEAITNRDGSVTYK